MPADTTTTDSTVLDSLAKPTGPARGSLVGRRYVVLETLGQGESSTVFKAYDPMLSRSVAIKLTEIQKEETKTLPWVQEARALAGVSHPNVVKIHDVGQSEEHVFVAMELVNGMTFEAWLKERKPPLREILQVLSAAGRGLYAAHRVGCLHRDFRLENVIVANDGQIKVIEFGAPPRLTPRRAPVTPRGAPEGEKTMGVSRAVNA